MKPPSKKVLFLLLVTVLSLIYAKPFFVKGFFETHDGEWAIVRLAEMVREIKDFQLPPRWSDYLNHGFGYPLFLFTYPFPYYLGAVIKFLGIGYVATIKILFVASMLLSTVFMFFLGKKLVNEWAGLLAALFYLAAPYKLSDLYIRGSLGEALSFVIFPALFLIGINLITEPNRFTLIFTSVLLAVLILTHNIMALVFLPLWIIFLLVIVKSYYEELIKYSFKVLLPMLLLGLGLSAYFFVPAILEKKYLYLSTVNLADKSRNFILFSQFFNLTSVDNIVFYLGFPQLGAFLLSIVTFLFSRKIIKKKYLLLFYYQIASILLVFFFTQKSSAFLWTVVPLSWIDFPWRMAGVLIFFLSLSVIFLAMHKITLLIGIFLIVWTLTYNIKFTNIQKYTEKKDDYYLTNDATTTSLDELMPVWVRDKATNRYQTKVEIMEGDMDINNLKYNSRMIEFDADVKMDSLVQINTIYFPGWKIFIDGKEATVNFNNNQGLIQVIVNQGSQKVEGKFTQTPVRKTADIITLLSLGGIVGIIILPIIKRK